MQKQTFWKKKDNSILGYYILKTDFFQLSLKKSS